jgi:Carbohydrate family 9 binding domain-like
MSRVLALAVVVLTASHALAQRSGDDRGKRLGATRISTPPTIDGYLDDAAWKQVAPDTRFTQNFPDEGRAPSQRTELYVGYDDRALYIAVRAWDTDAKHIVERLTRRDRDTDADKIQIDISSKNDRITAYHFDVNCAGVLEDAVRFNDTDYSSDWDGLWLGAAHRDAHGWSAELSIPWKTLRYEGGRTEFGF